MGGPPGLENGGRLLHYSEPRAGLESHHEGKVMRVLLQLRANYREVRGGDETVASRTAEGLQRLGVETELSSDVDLDLTSYDLVHVIDAAPRGAAVPQSLPALRQGKPLVLTPIFWDWKEYEEHRWLPGALEDPTNPELAHRLRTARIQVSAAKRRFLAEMADIVLPSSDAERDCLRAVLGVQHSRFTVVPFAADESYAGISPEPFVQRYGLRDFILCVARIEDKKNQLALVQACRRLGLPLVLIGDPYPNYEGYQAECRKAAGDSTLLMLPYTEPQELGPVYAAAKVHALPSWFEMPGLVSLDAAVAGCNVVASGYGPIKEYLGDLAWYCDPNDSDSIASAIAAAYSAPRSMAPRNHVLSRYSWARTAQATFDAYSQVLDERAQRKGSAPAKEELANKLRLMEELAGIQESDIWLRSLANADLVRQVNEHRAVLADRERQMAEHTTVLADCQRQLAEHKTVLADRERQLGEYRSALAYYQRQLAERKSPLAQPLQVARRIAGWLLRRRSR